MIYVALVPSGRMVASLFLSSRIRLAADARCLKSGCLNGSAAAGVLHPPPFDTRRERFL
jgi:hypothetical protein